MLAMMIMVVLVVTDQRRKDLVLEAAPPLAKNLARAMEGMRAC